MGLAPLDHGLFSFGIAVVPNGKTPLLRQGVGLLRCLPLPVACDQVRRRPRPIRPEALRRR